MEEWKDIKGYEGLYQASTLGNVRSIDRTVIRYKPYRVCNQKGRTLTPIINKGTRKGTQPRQELRLSKEGRVRGHQVHRLVAFTFLGGTEDMEVNHKDGNPLNNRLDNLEIVTRAQNIRHAFENNLIATSFPVIKMDATTREVIAEFYSVSQAARTIPISQGSLRFHLEKRNGKAYKGYMWEYKLNP